MLTFTDNSIRQKIQDELHEKAEWPSCRSAT